MAASAQKPAGNQDHPFASKSELEGNFLAENKVLLDKVESSKIPATLKLDLADRLKRLNRSMQFGSYQADYESTSKYINWLLALPWENRSEDKLDLTLAKQTLDKSHYGLEKIKERIIEYLAVLKLQSEAENSGVIKISRSPVLCFVGLPGTGKTSFALAIAQALGREFVRIPMGGMSNALVLRGQPRGYPEAEPGMVVKSLRRAGTKNPVVLLDEIDSTAEGAASDIMGVLLELLDPEQNSAFTDYYIDFPFDLSEVLFLCSANKLGNITSAVMDRMEVILMPRYTDDDKIHIARDYLFPRELSVVGLKPETVSFDEAVWPLVIKPFGYEIDVRNMERTINGILRKVARKYVDGSLQQVTINSSNLKDFLPEW
ncbi:MAG: AAA family ATPase [bacterium]|nr:AAA family ATPase [bacterium]